MKKLALCFSGQGSQYLNMGIDYIEANPEDKNWIKQVSSLLEFDVNEALQSENAFEQTLKTQPLIVLKSLLGLRHILKLDPEISGITGFSLGEYTAYYASGVFSLPTLLSLVQKRAEVMEQATLINPGKMAAVIGLDREKILEVIAPFQTKGTLVIANENEPKQYVISGEEPILLEAVDALKAAGARRVIVLRTSGAFHTSLMDKAQQQFSQFIQNSDILKSSKPKYKQYMNLNAKVLQSQDLLMHLTKQMTHPVKFIDIIFQMKKDGITHFLEIGPGKVLTGLIQRIDPELTVMSFDKWSEYETVKGWLNTHGFTK